MRSYGFKSRRLHDIEEDQTVRFGPFFIEERLDKTVQERINVNDLWQ